MKTRTLLVWMIATGLAATGCTVNQTAVPELAGPSDLAKSLTVTATPDNLYYNGQQATVVIEAHDATGGPLANQRVHLNIVTNGIIANDCGHLALSDVTTASDGRTATVFTAPPLPLPFPECQNLSNGLIQISANPIGSNFETATFFNATIRLRIPPTGSSSSGAFSVNFSIVASPTAGEPRKFTFADQGSVSPGHTISSYVWNWSDGASKSGPTVDHDFPGSGTFTATLTVTDDIGQSVFKTGLVTVS